MHARVCAYLSLLINISQCLCLLFASLLGLAVWLTLGAGTQPHLFNELDKREREV
jgi:hypothetical protein